MEKENCRRDKVDENGSHLLFSGCSALRYRGHHHLKSIISCFFHACPSLAARLELEGCIGTTSIADS